MTLHPSRRHPKPIPLTTTLSLPFCRIPRRGSYEARPPPLTRTDTYWPGRDRKYADLRDDQLPLTESLKDCMERTEPMWKDRIQREIKLGRNVLVVAHANTLRGLVKTMDQIGDDDIKGASSRRPVLFGENAAVQLHTEKTDTPTSVHTHVRSFR